jgi:hypothetical protein
LKVFLTGEAFPHLVESVISNSSKYVSHPLYLHWRPKDLIRLVSWRLNLHLEHQALRSIRNRPDWSNFNDVHQNVWVPHFGRNLLNVDGMNESTFPFLLRHTQLRPRQLILLCNGIAEKAREGGTFPYMPEDTLRMVARSQSSLLAVEVLNSYKAVYPQVARIVEALVGLPITFKGSQLDKVASRTASLWTAGEYSPLRFRQLVAELGIVGRVRRFNDGHRIAEADFEYTSNDRLALQVDDDCVIHPMFFEKLGIDTTDHVTVFPFPDHPEFEPLRN